MLETPLAPTPITLGDNLDRIVAWHSGDDIRALTKTAARLEFELQNAKLYSFWIE